MKQNACRVAHDSKAQSQMCLVRPFGAAQGQKVVSGFRCLQVLASEGFGDCNVNFSACVF